MALYLYAVLMVGSISGISTQHSVDSLPAAVVAATTENPEARHIEKSKPPSMTVWVEVPAATLDMLGDVGGAWTAMTNCRIAATSEQVAPKGMSGSASHVPAV
jgi:hypothetical protein